MVARQGQADSTLSEADRSRQQTMLRLSESRIHTVPGWALPLILLAAWRADVVAQADPPTK